MRRYALNAEAFDVKRWRVEGKVYNGGPEVEGDSLSMMANIRGKD